MKRISESQLIKISGGSELSNAIWWLIGATAGVVVTAFETYSAKCGSDSYANGNRWH